jgi:hypothetical protein
MAGGVSLVLVGLICAFWVLVGECSLSDGFAFTMFFTVVIAVLVLRRRVDRRGVGIGARPQVARAAARTASGAPSKGRVLRHRRRSRSATRLPAAGRQQGGGRRGADAERVSWWCDRRGGDPRP